MSRRRRTQPAGWSGWRAGDRGSMRSAALLVAALALLLPACGLLWAQKPSAPLGLLAVLPIEAVPLHTDTTLPDTEAAADRLDPAAGPAVTAQIYGALAERPDLRFVPDLTAAGACTSPTVQQAGTRGERAIALGKQTGAAAVIFGSVSRFRERVGSEYGASRPAAVSFELQLVDVSTEKILWHGAFDETQTPLTWNLFKAWMVWRAGPHWFTARELAGLGVQRLIDDLRNAAEP